MEWRAGSAGRAARPATTEENHGCRDFHRRPGRDRGADLRAQLRSQAGGVRPWRGGPPVGYRRARIHRSRHRDQRQLLRPPAPGPDRGGDRPGGASFPHEQPLLRGAHRAARGGSGGRHLRGAGVLLQLRSRGERGGDQDRAPPRGRGGTRAGRARDHHLRGLVSRTDPRDGDGDRAAQVPRGVRTDAGRVHLLPVQRPGGPRGRDLRSHLRRDARAGAGRRGRDAEPAGVPAPRPGPLPAARLAARARRDPVRDGPDREVLRLRMGAGRRTGRGDDGEGACGRPPHGRGSRGRARRGRPDGGHARLDVRRKSRLRGRRAGGGGPCAKRRSARERRPPGRRVPPLPEPDQRRARPVPGRARKGPHDRRGARRGVRGQGRSARRRLSGRRRDRARGGPERAPSPPSAQHR